MIPAQHEQALNSYVAPACPPDLDDAARTEWQRVTSLQRFYPKQLTLLLAYCESHSRWTASSVMLQAEGDVIERTISRGRTRLVENPRVKITARYQRQTVGYARQLGLNKAKPANDQVDVDSYNPFDALEEVDDYGLPEWHARHDLLDEAWTRRHFGQRSWNHDFDDRLGSLEGPGYNESKAEHDAWRQMHGEAQ